MNKKNNQFVMLFVVCFGLPLVLVGKQLWAFAGITGAIFLTVYFFSSACKRKRREIKFIDLYVIISYVAIALGCSLLYANGFDETVTIWIYILVVVAGYPFFKKLNKS
jgi:CDP-diglyceride synthetase